MSYFKFVPDLFLGVAELNRFQDFVTKDGFKKHLLEQSVSFGLVKTQKDLSFENGKVERDTNNSLGQKTIKISKIVAINSSGDFILNEPVNGIPIPSDGGWYWVKVTHLFSNQEVGTVSIDAAGNLVGVGTKFTDVLRGGTDFPSRIRFVNSNYNIEEYDVLDVISDTQAVLVHPAVTLGGEAEFVTESGLFYKIVGTFTDGVAVPNENKYPFNYNSAQLDIVPEVVANQRPAFTRGQEFYLARVRVVAGNLEIQDKRTEFWKTKGEEELYSTSSSENPLIGIEAVKWQHRFTSGARNIVEIAWGMRSDNWSVDSSLNILTIFGSSKGGSFKSVDDFTNGDFNGWRVYYKNGNYSKVVNSLKQGSAINLYLDVLDVDNLSNDGGISFEEQQVLIVPDCEEVEISFETTQVQSANEVFTFASNTPLATCLPIVFKDPICNYIVKYRYKNFKQYTEWTPIASGSYLIESSFDENGALRAESEREWYNYVSSEVTEFVQLTMSPNSFNRFSNVAYKGDKIGVNVISQLTSTQVMELKVGVDKRYQYITGQVSISDDMYISISRLKAVEGNEFRIHFDCALQLGGNKIHIVDDYSSGTLRILKSIDQGDVYSMMNTEGGIIFTIVYSGSEWILSQNYDKGQPFEVRMFSGQLSQFFNLSTGMGKVRGWYGFSLMNGKNGTPDISDRFIKSSFDEQVVGTVAGSNDVTLQTANLPPHQHRVYGKSEKRATGQGFHVLQPYLKGATDGTDAFLETEAAGEGKPFTIDPSHFAVAFAQKLY